LKFITFIEKTSFKIGIKMFTLNGNVIVAMAKEEGAVGFEKIIHY
jgi:hypothetical protein